MPIPWTTAALIDELHPLVIGTLMAWAVPEEAGYIEIVICTLMGIIYIYSCYCILETEQSRIEKESQRRILIEFLRKHSRIQKESLKNQRRIKMESFQKR